MNVGADIGMFRTSGAGALFSAAAVQQLPALLQVSQNGRAVGQAAVVGRHESADIRPVFEQRIQHCLEHLPQPIEVEKQRRE